MRTLRDKRVLLTGAAAGIGRAMAHCFASEGAHLYLVDIDQTGLLNLQTELRSAGVEAEVRICDVSEPAEIDACVADVLESWGEIDVLVNNAGVCFYGSTENTPQHMWDKVLAINLHAPIRFTNLLLPTLKSRAEAHVLNVCSMYGLFATNRCAAYHASKFGMVGFTEALRAETGRDHIGVTALCPGFVETGLFSALADEAQTPAKRPPGWVCATPETVAKKAVKAVLRNKPLVLVTTLAYLGYAMKRLAPSFISGLYGLGRKRKPAAAQPELNVSHSNTSRAA